MSILLLMYRQKGALHLTHPFNAVEETVRLIFTGGWTSSQIIFERSAVVQSSGQCPSWQLCHRDSMCTVKWKDPSPLALLCEKCGNKVKREDRDPPLHSLQVTLFSTLWDKAYYYASDIGPQCVQFYTIIEWSERYSRTFLFPFISFEAFIWK